jgi:integrase
MSDENKYLVLKGANKDIYYVKKRVPPALRFIVDKEYINESTKSSDIKVARKRRDEILLQMSQLEERVKLGEFDVLLDRFKNMDREKLEDFKQIYVDYLYSEYPWAGHSEQGNLPDPTESELTKLDAINTALGDDRPEKHSLTLSNAMHLNWRYKKDYAETTLSNHKKSLERYKKFAGVDPLVKNIKRRDGKNFKIHLEKLPEKLSNATIQRHFSDLSMMWKAGRDEEGFERLNPFGEHDIQVSKGRKSYLAWHPDDLRMVVDELTAKPFDPLMVKIAWYTGSRLGECFSIRPDDIYQDKLSSVWVVSIKPDREEQEFISKLDESAKNENARRVVPIHNDLMEDLMKFRQSNEGWDRANPSAYSKEFGRKKYLIKDPVNKVSKRYAFHSIRHNVATNFDRARVEERIAARLVGHSTVGATMSFGYYSEGDDFQTALETINKLPAL